MIGRVVSVEERYLGSVLTTALAGGETTIVVDDASDFDEAGELTLDPSGSNEVLSWTAVDDDSGTLALSGDVAGTYADGTLVQLYPLSVERWAIVVSGDSAANEEGMLVRVPHALYDRIPVGIRDLDAGEGETVSASFISDELVIQDVTGQAPLVDGTYLAPGTVPSAAITDGVAPSSSPTPTVIGGPSFIAARWTAVDNHDPVTYEVHISASSGFTPGPSTLYAETAATGSIIKTLADNSALAYGILYFVKIIAKDADGSAAAGAQGSAAMVKITTVQVDTDNGSPSTPSTPTIVDGPGWIQAKWTAPSGTSDPLQYKVYIRAGSDPTVSDDTYAVGTTTALSLVISKLADGTALVTGTTYYVKVRAISMMSANQSAASTSGTGTPAAVPTSGLTTDGLAPTSSPTAVVKPGPSLLYASWDPVSNADPVQYEVHLSTSTGFTPSGVTLLGVTPGTTWVTTVDHSGTVLTNGTTYYVKVVAKDADGSASAGTQGSAAPYNLASSTQTTDGSPPSAVGSAPTVQGGIGYLTAFWSPVSNNDPVQYEVHLSTSTGFTPGGGTLVLTTPGSSAVIRKDASGSDLAYGTTYYVKVVAKDADGSASASSQGSGSMATAVTADLTNNLITTAKIAADAVTSAELANNAVDAAAIQALAVTTAKLDANAVTTAKIAADAVTAAELAANAVDTAALQAAAVTGTKIAANTITASNITAGTITATEIAAATITGAKIAANTIAAGNIVAGTITATEIAASTITGSKIAAGTITASNITASTITATEIAAATITGAKIAAATIAAGNIVANTITASQIAAGTITSTEIHAATITGSNIAATTITAANITAGTITATEIAAATITGSKIAATTITASNIAANTITASQITAGTITATEIAAATITGAKIAATTITASNIVSGTITSTQIAATTITASNIVSGTITTTQIAAGTITGSNIAGTTITATNIAAGTITTTQIAATTITASNIAASTITGAKIAANTITASNIVADTITATEIAAATITSSELAVGSVTADKLEASLVLSTKIITGTASGTRIELGETASGSGMYAYGSDGTTVKFSVDAGTGDVYAAGRIDFGAGSRLDSDIVELNELPATGFQTPSLVQSAGTAYSNTTSSKTIAWPSPTTKGSLLLLAVFVTGLGTTVPTITTPSGWTLVTSKTQGVGRLALFKITSSSTRSGNETVAWTITGDPFSNNAHVTFQLFEHSGTAAQDVAAVTASGTNSTVATGSTTATTQASEIGTAFVGCCEAGPAGASQSPTSVTNGYASVRLTHVASGANTLTTLNVALSSTGTTSTGGTLSQNTTWMTIITTFKAKAATIDAPAAGKLRIYALDDGQVSTGSNASTLILQNELGIEKSLEFPGFTKFHDASAPPYFWVHSDFCDVSANNINLSTACEGMVSAFSGTGSGVTAAQVTTGHHNGTVRLVPGTTSTGIAQVRSSHWNMPPGSGRLRMGALVRVPTVSDGTDTFFCGMGFKDFDGSWSNLVTGGNAIVIRYSHGTNSGKWQAGACGGASSSVDLGVTVVANTWYWLEIDVAADGSEAKFYVNGALGGTLNTNMPTAALGYAVGTQKTLGTTSRSFDCDYYYCYWEHGTRT